MTRTTANKRLDKIETYLTPKEWAIRLADEARKYPNVFAQFQNLSKLAINQLPMQRPFFAFKEQAEERHPGGKPQDIRARDRLTDGLWNEFHTMKILICRVNQVMQRKVERCALQAALQLAALHALILQDAFAHTATQAAALIATQKQREAKNEQKAMVEQLTAFTKTGQCDTQADSVHDQDDFDSFPSPLEEWQREHVILLKDFYNHRAAVELVQIDHFDGHSILFSDLEAELNEMTRTIESAIGTTNEYLKCRAEYDDAGTNEEACENRQSIDLGSIKANTNDQETVTIAEKWLQDANFEAIESDAEQWERYREEFREKE